MVGQLANRAQFGLILPSTNTSVEAEFNRMLVPGRDIRFAQVKTQLMEIYRCIMAQWADFRQQP